MKNAWEPKPLAVQSTLGACDLYQALSVHTPASSPLCHFGLLDFSRRIYGLQSRVHIDIIIYYHNFNLDINMSVATPSLKA